MSFWTSISATAQTVLDTLRGVATGVASAGRNGTPEAGIAFTIAVIAMSAKMAKADGQVTADEVEAFRQVFHVAPEDETHVSRVFNMARQDVAGYEAYARQVARMFRDRPGVLEDLMDGLFHIARADGVIHDAELAFLEDVAAIFGFSEFEFSRIKASNLGEPFADPYLVLGVTPDATNDDLKKAYRRAVAENHPDRLIARGVPPEFIELANAKLVVINDAWERLKKARGIT